MSKNTATLSAIAISAALIHVGVFAGSLLATVLHRKYRGWSVDSNELDQMWGGTVLDSALRLHNK
jgi:hypothetical protein